MFTLGTAALGTGEPITTAKFQVPSSTQPPTALLARPSYTFKAIALGFSQRCRHCAPRMTCYVDFPWTSIRKSKPPACAAQLSLEQPDKIFQARASHHSPGSGVPARKFVLGGFRDQLPGLIMTVVAPGGNPSFGASWAYVYGAAWDVARSQCLSSGIVPPICTFGPCETMSSVWIFLEDLYRTSEETERERGALWQVCPLLA